MAPIVCKQLWSDFLCDTGVSLPKKLWAYRRGFLSERIRLYGLTGKNYRSYVSDFAYWRLHPINGPYSKWIDDKLTMRQVLSTYSDYMPKYFYHLQNGRVLPLVDHPFPEASSHSEESIIQLLRTEHNLIAKPCAAERGRGFHKLSVREPTAQTLFVDHRQVSVKELTHVLKDMQNYIITECVTPHADIRRLCPSTSNPVRLIVVNDPPAGPTIVWAHVKFGVKESGAVETLAAGAVFCPVALANGELLEPVRYVDGELTQSSVHPDTNVSISGCIPHWDLVKGTLIRIGRSFPQLRYIGYDVIVTDSAFKVIEMNSQPSLVFPQLCTPLMENHHFRRLLAGASQR